MLVEFLRYLFTYEDWVFDLVSYYGSTQNLIVIMVIFFVPMLAIAILCLRDLIVGIC